MKKYGLTIKNWPAKYGLMIGNKTTYFESKEDRAKVIKLIKDKVMYSTFTKRGKKE